VNIGILLACVTVYSLAGTNPRYVFLVGILPALLVFWIRRQVPEPEEWHREKSRNEKTQPRAAELFRGPVRRTTLLCLVVCATSLSAWWAFMFWHTQHLRNLPELASWPAAEKQRLASQAFFLIVGISIVGNFVAGALASQPGYRRSIAVMFLGLFAAMFSTFFQTPSYQALVWFWFPAIGFFSGVFGLFTMYLPPLFPTLLRTTGAGFCFNIGRIAAAFGTVYFGRYAHLGDFRHALLYAGFLLVPAMIVALLLPEHEPTVPTCPTN